MEDNTSSRCHSKNRCFPLNIKINININENKDDCESVPEISNRNENIQININKNSNGFHQSVSLGNKTKSYIDSSQQTDDGKYKLNKENHKSVVLSVDLAVLDQTGKQNQGNKCKDKDKSNNNNQVDINNGTMDDSFEINDTQNPIGNMENNEENDMVIKNELEKEKTGIPGGLRNSESTCYMNAMIQALSSSDFLINALGELSKSNSNSSISLLYKLLKALNEPNINNETIMRNTNLLEDLIESVGWTKPSQQDAFELLSTLICDIYEKSDDKDKIEIPLRIKLLHEFQGIDINNRVQEYLGLSIKLCKNYNYKPGVPLQFLINQHFVSITIDGDESRLTKLSLYREIPNILLIHIQANKYDPIKGQIIKPIYYIQYEENMILCFDIAHEINGKNRNLNEDRILGTQVEYHLKSIVVHAGDISGGHYIAYKKWQNEWYIADDESIIKEPLKMSPSPYIMIYERSSRN